LQLFESYRRSESKPAPNSVQAILDQQAQGRDHQHHDQGTEIDVIVMKRFAPEAIADSARDRCRENTAELQPPHDLPVDESTMDVNRNARHLVKAANKRSIPTAARADTPITKTSMGIISAPPPTPIIPTSIPTTNAAIEIWGPS